MRGFIAESPLLTPARRSDLAVLAIECVPWECGRHAPARISGDAPLLSQRGPRARTCQRCRLGGRSTGVSLNGSSAASKSRSDLASGSWDASR